MKQVFLGLGSNLGARRMNLQSAVTGLQGVVQITAVSPVYETKAWGITDQPDFLNICVGGLTELAPLDLLYFVKNLESEIGRTPAVRWGPRLIDIDILFYDTVVFEDAELTIPHVGIPERATVLIPLAAIAPDWVHPQKGRTVSEMVTAVDVSGVVWLPEPLFPEK